MACQHPGKHHHGDHHHHGHCAGHPTGGCCGHHHETCGLQVDQKNIDLAQDADKNRDKDLKKNLNSPGPRPPIKVDFDTQEWSELLAILEEMEDQQQACALLAELNEKSAAWGKLFMNLAPDLENAAWKEACDQAQQELCAVIKKIKEQAL